jgi:hypothetical protein
MSSSSWYDFFHLDGTHPVKVEPLLKSKVWIIIFLFDYLKQGFRVLNEEYFKAKDMVKNEVS